MSKYRLSKHFGNDPATSANPPVLINGTASDVANKILLLTLKDSAWFSHAAANPFAALLIYSIIILQKNTIGKPDFYIPV